MCDRSTKRRLCRFLSIHVYELKIISRISELINTFLRNFQPFGRWKFGTNQLRKVCRFDGFCHWITRSVLITQPRHADTFGYMTRVAWVTTAALTTG